MEELPFIFFVSARSKLNFFFFPTMVIRKIYFLDCSINQPLVVNSTSATYDSVGTFSCANNKSLFYTNGTQATDVQTTCLAKAKWSGEENVACFKGCGWNSNFSV